MIRMRVVTNVVSMLCVAMTFAAIQGESQQASARFRECISQVRNGSLQSGSVKGGLCCQELKLPENRRHLSDQDRQQIKRMCR